MDSPYNPLDKKHLGESVAEAMLERPIHALGSIRPFKGAGIYAVYYTGTFPSYRSISERNTNGKFTAPIYVGKAVPKGARKGGLDFSVPHGNVLYSRLAEHAETIKQAENLELDDFFYRHLVVDDIWIPLGESLLVRMFTPVWNQYLEGFGNHDPGSGRHKQRMAPWDVVHPGRAWAKNLQPSNKAADEFLAEIVRWLEKTAVQDTS